jgi:hypothetical protein
MQSFRGIYHLLLVYAKAKKKVTVVLGYGNAGLSTRVGLVNFGALTGIRSECIKMR